MEERTIDENALHDNKHTSTIDRYTDDASNPVNIGISCPGEEEQSYRRAKAGEKRGDQTMFLGAETTLHDVRNQVPIQVGTVDCHSDQT